MNRRTFFGKCLLVAAAVLGLSKTGKGARKWEYGYVHSPYIPLSKNLEEKLLCTTWEYQASGLVTTFGGSEFWLSHWDMEFGCGLTPDCIENLVTDDSGLVRGEKLFYPVNIISPFQVSRCNVQEGWVEYYEANFNPLRSKSVTELWSRCQPRKDSNGNLVFKRVYLGTMEVNLLSKKGEVIAKLHRKENKCSVEYLV